MPVEVKSKEDFMNVASRAIEIRVKRGREYAKVKARTKKYLYTLKVTLSELDSLINELKKAYPDIPVNEIP
ncbi:MAG: 60S ribosomal protein L38 [Sulfolobales archaeon]|nr:60S ribosomal protein L38 [Sulfolobales archaeon]MCX8199687.1 60S ribosomal protein L38 [Sulfolobales archaeon]MDW8170641.1 hypothetical protein [Desulfurococcaceae archaeon]